MPYTNRQAMFMGLKITKFSLPSEPSQQDGSCYAEPKILEEFDRAMNFGEDLGKGHLPEAWRLAASLQKSMRWVMVQG